MLGTIIGLIVVDCVMNEVRKGYKKLKRGEAKIEELKEKNRKLEMELEKLKRQ